MQLDQHNTTLTHTLTAHHTPTTQTPWFGTTRSLDCSLDDAFFFGDPAKDGSVCGHGTSCEQFLASLKLETASKPQGSVHEISLLSLYIRSPGYPTTFAESAHQESSSCPTALELSRSPLPAVQKAPALPAKSEGTQVTLNLKRQAHKSLQKHL